MMTKRELTMFCILTIGIIIGILGTYIDSPRNITELILILSSLGIAVESLMLGYYYDKENFDRRTKDE